jgi:hypothetical protein
VYEGGFLQLIRLVEKERADLLFANSFMPGSPSSFLTPEDLMQLKDQDVAVSSLSLLKRQISLVAAGFFVKIIVLSPKSESLAFLEDRHTPYDSSQHCWVVD